MLMLSGGLRRLAALRAVAAGAEGDQNSVFVHMLSQMDNRIILSACFSGCPGGSASLQRRHAAERFGAVHGFRTARFS